MMKSSQSGYGFTMGYLFLMAIPCFLIFAYAINFLLNLFPLVPPAIIERVLSSTPGVLHVLGGLIAIVLGPFQFLDSLRKRIPWLHRWLGRVYVGAVFVSGVCGFYISFFAGCYLIGKFGFAALGMLWLRSLEKAVRSIREGDTAAHKRWMIRDFALTYAAVMLRWQFPVLRYLEMAPRTAYTVVAFTCWVPQVLAVELWLMYSEQLSSVCMQPNAEILLEFIRPESWKQWVTTRSERESTHKSIRR
ncbi:hypothetical protein F5X99DRAFT_400315 [Biscogniauxia marginata]|nr:hypothetical protein F5X99DRAFT_400315 [Biscogniauxia marginata]